MKKVDALLRWVDHRRGVEDDNTNVTLLKPEYFHVKALQQGHVLIEGAEAGILSKIRKAKDFDENIIKAVEEMRKTSTKTLRSDEWSEEQGLILFRGKVYVPKDKDLRREIVKLHHDSVVAGHPGRWKTLELVSLIIGGQESLLLWRHMYQGVTSVHALNLILNRRRVN